MTYLELFTNYKQEARQAMLNAAADKELWEALDNGNCVKLEEIFIKYIESFKRDAEEAEGSDQESCDDVIRQSREADVKQYK